MSPKAGKAQKSNLERIEHYLAALAPEKRAALEKLRGQIKSAAPGAVERISYGIPAFDLDGPLVGYAAAKTHCSFFPMNGSTIAAFAEELSAYDTAKGTVRFDPKKPLPASLVKKIVKARIAENKAAKSAVGKPSAKTPAKSAPAKKAAPAKTRKNEDDVDGFFAALKHPLKKEIAEVRAIMLGVDKKIAEGVKWNSLSFRAADYFATVNLRSADAVQLVFHRGAKAKDGERDMAIPDEKGLMKRLSSDRCLVTLGKGPEIAANRKAFEAIIRAWLRQI